MAGYSRPPERDDTDVIGARIGAQILDQILIVLIAVFAGMFMGMFGAAAGSAELASSLMLLAIVVFAAGYFLLLEGIWDGQTLGKKLLGIKVVKEDGSECGIKASVLRNVLRVVDALFYYVVGFVFMASSDKRQRLGDRIAGTVVVKEE